MFPFYVIIILEWVQEILLLDEVLLLDDGSAIVGQADHYTHP